MFVVVRAVLIPFARKAGLNDTVDKMNHWIAWTVHNVNVAMLVGEYALNTLRLVPAHFVFMLYYACLLYTSPSPRDRG